MSNTSPPTDQSGRASRPTAPAAPPGSQPAPSAAPRGIAGSLETCRHCRWWDNSKPVPIPARDGAWGAMANPTVVAWYQSAGLCRRAAPGLAEHQGDRAHWHATAPDDWCSGYTPR